MNRAKIAEFIDMREYKDTIHVIGVGAIGSNVCEQLARLGAENIEIYDFDTVSDHNIANQLFTSNDIGKMKVEAVAERMKAINPECQIKVHPEGLQEPYFLQGIAIICVDSIELRKKIVEANMYNINCHAMLDFRMRLTDAQYYFACEYYQYEKLLGTMDFTHEEAAESTPTSACGYEQSVFYAPSAIVSYGIANLVNWLKGQEYKNLIFVDLARCEVQGFTWKNKKKSKIDEMIKKYTK